MPCPIGFLGIFRHESLELGLGGLVLEVGRSRATERGSELSPSVGRAHVDDADGLDPRAGRLDTEQARGLAAFNAAPELFLGRQQEVLVEGIGRNGDLDPLAAARDDRKDGRFGVDDPHIVLDLRHVLFGRGFFRKRPGQHELGLKHRPGLLDDAVKRRPHPSQHGVPDVSLNVFDQLARVPLVPLPIERLRH